MARVSVYDVQELPWVYRLSQRILVPGAARATRLEIEGLLRELPSAEQILDIGCGPVSKLWSFGLDPVGLDMSSSYVEEFRKHGGEAHVGSADDLPFADGSFDGVWSFGLVHHLSDSQARSCLSEAMRVVRPGGYVVVFDAVLPEAAWRRPLAWLQRKLDRGNFVRREKALRELFPRPDEWTFLRRCYTKTGLERLVCTYRVED